MADGLITITRARELVLAAVTELAEERIAVEDGLGRVLRADLIATGDVPPFPSSAMDGYAILAGPADRTIEIVGESRAGTPGGAAITERTGIRISTGAAVPATATAVIPQENTEATATGIRTLTSTAEGQNIRYPGEDMRAGTIVLSAGARLGAVELGAVVAAGAGTVTVARRPHAAVLCTGDELKAPGEPLAPGEIHNSNAPMLVGLASNAGALVEPAQRLPDDRAATEAGIAGALATCDVVIISGGVSVGPHDHVKPVLATLGVREVFWSVSLQPGKPTWFGTLEHILVFGLPGNPVSAVVAFSLFVAPAIAALQGTTPRPPLDPEATLETDVRRNPRREQAVRVRLRRQDGRTLATPNGGQGSHILSSLVGADALAMIPPGEGVLPAGTTVALRALAR
jgi:molybdopterin molybdotransferase